MPLSLDEELKRLWEEFVLRQNHFWAGFTRFGIAAVTINIVPYMQPSLTACLGRLACAFPAAGLVFSLACTWYLSAEYQRLRMVREAYDTKFQSKRRIPRMPDTGPWNWLMARRIGPAVSVLFGIALACMCAFNFYILWQPSLRPVPESAAPQGTAQTTFLQAPATTQAVPSRATGAPGPTPTPKAAK